MTLWFPQDHDLKSRKATRGYQSQIYAQRQKTAESEAHPAQTFKQRGPPNTTASPTKKGTTTNNSGSHRDLPQRKWPTLISRWA
jgi:hypothetical protein